MHEIPRYYAAACQTDLPCPRDRDEIAGRVEKVGEVKLAHLRQQNAELSLRARRLEAADPAVIEDLARRKLEMMKAGEVLFIDGTPAGSADASTAPAPSRSR